jgi:hypothetical protein
MAKQHVVVVLDDSGSMDDRMRSGRRVKKIEAAKEALLLVLQRLPSESEIGIVLLNGRQGGSSWIWPLGPIDLPLARRMIRQVNAEGGTPLGEFLKVGADALLAQRAKHHYGEYRLLIVTDGEATDPQLVESYLPDLLTRGLTLDVIGVDMPSDHSLATRVDSYRRADDLPSLVRAIREVLAESSDAASDTGETDFELLQPLSDDAAAAMLTALADGGNGPIQAWREDGPDWEPQLPPAAGQAPPAGRRRLRLSLPALLGILLFCYLISRILQARRPVR